MKEKEGFAKLLEKCRKNVPALAGALIMVLVFLTFLLLCGRSDKKLAPEILILGDSVYAHEREKDSIASMLSQRLGKEVMNGALGGTSMARTDSARYLDHTMDLLSMTALSKAVISGDFAPQKQTNIRFAATEYFDEVIGELSQVDFGKVKLLMIAYGLNDYQHGIKVEDAGDRSNEYTYGGALRVALSGIRKRYPDLRIVLVTPTYSWYPGRGCSCEEAYGEGGVLADYVACLETIAKEYDVEVIDLYHDLYEPEAWYEEYTVDGVHPNETGRKMICDRIAGYLEEHP